MTTQAIIPAAGIGVRLGAGVAKPLIKIFEKPLVIYCLEQLQKSNLVDSLILVVNKENRADFESLLQNYPFTKKIKLVDGGETRKDSVWAGLQAVDENTEMVLVHDAARPLITVDVIDASIRLCQTRDAVVVGVPVTPTIKKVNAQMEVVETLNRDELWEIQTPQVFKKDILVRAHQGAGAGLATDDAMLVEQSGARVTVLKGGRGNIKVTTPEDIKFVEFVLTQ